MRAAQVALGKYLQKLADERRGTALPFAEPPRPTVGRICEEFMAMKKVEADAETVSWYEQKLAPFLEEFAAKVLGELSYEDGVRFKGHLQEKRTVKGPLGVGTVNAHLRAAKAVLNWASKPSRRARTGLSSNPWEEIKFGKEKPRERLITDEEMTHLLAQCEDGGVSGGADDFREQLIVLRYTTLRPGEMRGLRWEYIDWEQSRVVFPPSKVKTRRRREATLIDRVKSVLEGRLKRLREEGAPLGFVFTRPGKDQRGKRRAGHGSLAITANSLSQRFRRLLLRCVDLGLIEKEKNGERIVPYSTRHTRATSLFMEGHSHAVVMFDMGHSVPQTTERYKHLAGSFVAEEIRRKDRDRGREREQEKES
jgi:integrase